MEGLSHLSGYHNEDPLFGHTTNSRSAFQTLCSDNHDLATSWRKETLDVRGRGKNLYRVGRPKLHASAPMVSLASTDCPTTHSIWNQGFKGRNNFHTLPHPPRKRRSCSRKSFPLHPLLLSYFLLFSLSQPAKRKGLPKSNNDCLRPNISLGGSSKLLSKRRATRNGFCFFNFSSSRCQV